MLPDSDLMHMPMCFTGLTVLECLRDSLQSLAREIGLHLSFWGLVWVCSLLAL